MIWQQPWAWIGLAAIALPVIIHLLGLGRARRQPFPTLRFVEITRPTPTRRTRLHDPWLLLLRVLIIAAAVAALAQPLRRTGSRQQAFAQSLARVVVLDTSRSVQRMLGAETAEAIDSLRRIAQRLADEADVSRLLESASPADALAGAEAWLAQQRQRREVVIVSDFQVGSVNEPALTRVPSDIGLRFVRVGSNAPAPRDPLETRAVFGETEITARAMPTGIPDTTATARTEITWTARRVDTTRDTGIRLLAGDTEHARAHAALAAARAMSADPVTRDTAPRVIAVITPGYERRAELLASAPSPREPWMTDALAALRSDAVLQDLQDLVLRDITLSDIARQDTLGGRPALLLFSSADAGSLATAALLAAARRAVAPAADLHEEEPAVITDDALARWQRPPSDALRAAPNSAADVTTDGESDARWLWLLVLLLLGIETVWRRRLRTPSAESVPA